jgi:Spherulation-specific family 4
MLLCTAVVVSGMIGLPPPAIAGSLGVLVPAYFYPGTGGSDGYTDGWAQMAATANQIPVTAIFNPDSGPLPGPADPNYVNAMTNLENAGGKIVAYVYTNYANVPLSTVEGQISTYITQYGKLVNGFFLDAMTNDSSASDLAYYHSLYTFIKGLSLSYQVIGNPGTNTDPGYLAPKTQGADTLVTYENDAKIYQSTIPASWVTGYSPDHFANVLYNEPTVSAMTADITLAAQRNVGYVYVTDQALPNPYAQLPSYWDQEVAAIQSASVPESDAVVLLGSGCLLSSLAVAARRRGRASGRLEGATTVA